MSLWKGNRWFAWHTDYAQCSYIKSHLRTTLVPQPASSGNGKGCPTWSWTCLKMVCAWSTHSSWGGENRKGLPYRCAIYFHFVKKAMSDALALLSHIPASSAPETEIAFIESRNYLIFTGPLVCDVLCLTVTAWGQKSSKQSCCLSKKWPWEQERTACSLSRLGPLAVSRVFLFFRPETVSENSWGFPKPHLSGGQAPSDIMCEWWGIERGLRTRKSQGSFGRIAGNGRASARVVRKTRGMF